MVIRDQRRDVQTAAVIANLQDVFGLARPQSREHYEHAITRFHSGVTHDGRYLEPFQLAIARAEGAYKWDVDGNRYIDFVTGHGSLILGHSHPAVIEAVGRQLPLGTHLGGNHALEVAWADQVAAIVPGAERVRFVSSGTEATMLAIRLARVFTGRTTLVQFKTHFHGWNDTTFGSVGAPGLPVSLRNAARVIDCGDYGALRDALADETVAAVIIETSNPTFFTLPDPAEYLRFLRSETQRTGALLIVDEVVSGFRWAPGGAQEHYGVTGDLTALAKILAGGLPGGAVAGRADVLAPLAFEPEARRGLPKVAHPGTFNANPLSAAAGVACLELVANPAVQQQTNSAAAAIRAGMNSVLAEEGIPGCVYGASSMFRIELGGDQLPPTEDLRSPLPRQELDDSWTPGPAEKALNLHMLMRGVALFGGRGILSIAHGPDEIGATIDAFRGSLAAMRDEGIV
jgi:glutamate-1-semialdehyde 2,1-aminomutase